MPIPPEIERLLKQREDLRKEKKYSEADEVRKQIESLGYVIKDSVEGTVVSKKETIPLNKEVRKLIGVFGSGELSPTGRRVHEYLISHLKAPVKIALIETPAGFEVNPLNWYQKLSDMMSIGLQNFQPQISIIDALRKDGEKSTNNPTLLAPMLDADYIHAGAGSPSYAGTHLADSLAYQYMIDMFDRGSVLSFASAAAIAFSKYLLPVYEMYKVGEDLHWNKGTNFFAKWGLNLTIIPHWNNNEGGQGIDTSRCFMGVERFKKLLQMLPEPTPILGIDEQTACIFDLEKKEVKVMGNGTATVMDSISMKATLLRSPSSFSFEEFKL
ncbi:MAG: cysteinyl-tRNA synthetase [bacterium]|nr:cysteinyl-tRNA synthetase [bacterium]